MMLKRVESYKVRKNILATIFNFSQICSHDSLVYAIKLGLPDLYTETLLEYTD